MEVKCFSSALNLVSELINEKLVDVKIVGGVNWTRVFVGDEKDV